MSTLSQGELLCVHEHQIQYILDVFVRQPLRLGWYKYIKMLQAEPPIEELFKRKDVYICLSPSCALSFCWYLHIILWFEYQAYFSLHFSLNVQNNHIGTFAQNIIKPTLFSIIEHIFFNYFHVNILLLYSHISCRSSTIQSSFPQSDGH